MKTPTMISVRGSVFCLVLALTLAATCPVVADVLVTRDGSEIDIDGPWTVDGRLVRFTLPDGTLSVMRLSEVDLDASERATAEAAAPPPPPPPAVEERPVEPVWVLTDADIPAGEGNAGSATSADSDATSADAESADEATETAPVDPNRPLEVRDWTWRAATVDGGLWELEGTVVNRGQQDAYNLHVYFTAVGLDEDNQPQPEMDLLRPALVLAEELPVGEDTTFRYVVTEGDLRGDPSRFAEPRVSFDLRYKLRPADVPVLDEEDELEEIADDDTVGEPEVGGPEVGEPEAAAEGG